MPGKTPKQRSLGIKRPPGISGQYPLTPFPGKVSPNLGNQLRNPTPLPPIGPPIPGMPLPFEGPMDLGPQGPIPSGFGGRPAAPPSIPQRGMGNFGNQGGWNYPEVRPDGGGWKQPNFAIPKPPGMMDRIGGLFKSPAARKIGGIAKAGAGGIASMVVPQIAGAIWPRNDANPTMQKLNGNAPFDASGSGLASRLNRGIYGGGAEPLPPMQEEPPPPKAGGQDINLPPEVKKSAFKPKPRKPMLNSLAFGSTGVQLPDIEVPENGSQFGQAINESRYELPPLESRDIPDFINLGERSKNTALGNDNLNEDGQQSGEADAQNRKSIFDVYAEHVMDMPKREDNKPSKWRKLAAGTAGFGAALSGEGDGPATAYGILNQKHIEKTQDWESKLEQMKPLLAQETSRGNKASEIEYKQGRDQLIKYTSNFKAETDRMYKEGQLVDKGVQRELDRLRIQMQREVAEGKLELANQTRQELEEYRNKSLAVAKQRADTSSAAQAKQSENVDSQIKKRTSDSAVDAFLQSLLEENK